jgi:hypothetical protein
MSIDQIWYDLITRHYELILPAWAVFAIAIFLLRKRTVDTDAYPLLLALTWTPPLTAVLLGPDVYWPTYTSDLASRFHEAGIEYPNFPPLSVGLRNLVFHPGYVASGVLAIYATMCALSPRFRLRRVVGYGLAAFFLTADHVLSVPSAIS